MNLGILLDPWIWTDNMNSAVSHPGFTWGGRTPTPKVGVLTYFVLPKTARKWNILDRGWAGPWRLLKSASSSEWVLGLRKLIFWRNLSDVSPCVLDLQYMVHLLIFCLKYIHVLLDNSQVILTPRLIYLFAEIVLGCLVSYGMTRSIQLLTKESKQTVIQE